MTGFEILFSLSHRDGIESLLVFLPEVDVDLRHVGEDVELIGTDLDGRHSRSQVFVDNSLNTHMDAILLDDRNTAATHGDDDIAFLSQPLDQLDVLDVDRLGRSHHLTPAFTLGVFLVDSARGSGIGIGLLLSIIRANRLGGVLEHRVVLVDEHLGHESHHITVDVFLHHHLLQTHLNHVANLALGLGTAHIHRHCGDAVSFASGVLEQHIAHLRAVAVTDNQIITLFQEGQQRLASISHILHLFLASAFLSASQKRVSTKGDDS